MGTAICRCRACEAVSVTGENICMGCETVVEVESGQQERESSCAWQLLTRHDIAWAWALREGGVEGEVEHEEVGHQRGGK